MKNFLKYRLMFIASASAVVIINGEHAKAEPIPPVTFTNAVNKVDTKLFTGFDYTSWLFFNNSSTTITDLFLIVMDYITIISEPGLPGEKTYNVTGSIPIKTTIPPGTSTNLFDWVPPSYIITPPPVNPIWNTPVNTVVVARQEVPAPLPILGVGAAFGFGRRMRKRIKGSKTSEVISAIG